MPRRLLLVHPSRLEGENRGVHEQHIASMRALFDASEEWRVHALDLSHPAFPAAALAAELVVVHMLAAPEIEAVIRLRRQRNLATIFEVSDNFLDLGSWVPPRHTLRNPLVRQRIVYHASIADAVQVYAPGLAELCAHMNGRVVRLDPYVPLQPHTERAKGLVIGWGGTTSHEGDLAPIAPMLAELCRRHEDLTFAFIGNRAMGERLFGDIPPRQLQMREFSDTAAYYEFVRTWHIGLAPLGTSGFNAGRTDTKLATYAACGVAPVAEEGEVYRGHADHALLYRGVDGLRDALEWLLEDRSRVEELASRARTWAERERGLERLRAQRIAAYESFVERETGEDIAIDENPPSLAGGVEELRAVVREHPDYAQARLALADALRAMGDDHGALDVLDARPFPDVLSGLAAERQHAIAQKMCPERSAEYASRIDSPVARIRLTHGRSEPRAFFGRLLEQQPFDYIALSTVLRELLAHDHDSAEVRELCARACLVAPELVPESLRPPSLTRFLPA